MNTDARISVALPAHPKTKKLIRRGGQAAAWNLVCLFLWVSQSKPSGDLSGMTDEDIEIAAGWEGEEGKFVRLLSDVGFLDGHTNDYAVHDWEQHNPWAAGAERRSENSRVAARKRWGIAESSEKQPERKQKAPVSDAGSNGSGSGNGCDPHATSMQPECDPHADSFALGQSPVSDSDSDTDSVTESKDGGAARAPPQPRGCRLPDDWALTPDLEADAKRILTELRRGDVDIRLQADKFRDHFHAEPGAKGRKLDWPGTWRNWIRKHCEWTKAPNGTAHNRLVTPAAGTDYGRF